MIDRAIALLALLTVAAVPPYQNRQPKQADDQTIRISAELVQLDVVVTDKNGKIVRGLNKEDFELLENGKKQEIKFFEFVDAAGKGPRPAGAPPEAGREPTGQGPGAADVRRIFAFVVDDLTIRPIDLVYVR